jgi:hypothetical protein
VAAYTDGYAQPVKLSTYGFLQVICSAAERGRRTTAAAAADTALVTRRSLLQLQQGGAAAVTAAAAPSPAPASAVGSVAAGVVGVPRVTVLTAQPTLLTSWPWSLTATPVSRTSNTSNATEVGCSLLAVRDRGTTGQLLTGVLRLGNPVRPDAPGARVIDITSVSVTAQITGGTRPGTAPPQPVTALANCLGGDLTGRVQLLPFRRINCTFELRVASGPETAALAPLRGSLVARVLLGGGSSSSSSSGGSGELISDPVAFDFGAAAAATAPGPATGAGGAAATRGGLLQRSVGACAQLSGGMVFAEALPQNISEAAAAVAAAGVNGTTPAGTGGECTRVCGAAKPDGIDDTAVAPVAGYSKLQCGTYKVCVHCRAVTPSTDCSPHHHHHHVCLSVYMCEC